MKVEEIVDLLHGKDAQNLTDLFSEFLVYLAIVASISIGVIVVVTVVYRCIRDRNKD